MRRDFMWLTFYLAFMTFVIAATWDLPTAQRRVITFCACWCAMPIANFLRRHASVSP